MWLNLLQLLRLKKKNKKIYYRSLNFRNFYLMFCFLGEVPTFTWWTFVSVVYSFCALLVVSAAFPCYSYVILFSIFSIWKQWFEVENVLMTDLFLINAGLYIYIYIYVYVYIHIQDVNWWTGVVWIIVMFLSAVWTLILMAPIHCRGSIGEQVM